MAPNSRAKRWVTSYTEVNHVELARRLPSLAPRPLANYSVEKYGYFCDACEHPNNQLKLVVANPLLHRILRETAPFPIFFNSLP